MAKTGQRSAVVKAYSTNPGRWSLTLACGHKVEITSTVEPKAATCRACPADVFS